jgi:TRAP transporter 4TM/12TM fusion protein
MGIIAFIMAEYLQISYWSIVVAAIFPAALYYLAVYMQVDFEAAKTGLRGLARSELPNFWVTIKQGWYFVIPVLVLLFVLAFIAKTPLAFLGNTPVRAGFWALIALFAVSFFRKETRLGPTRALATLEGGAIGLARIGPAGAIVGIIMGGTSLTALGLRFSAGLVEMAGGNMFFLLLLAAVACIIMGMAISLIVTYLVLAILVAPALMDMGILPMAAHFFLLYYATVGLITPPVCIAAYAAAGIAQSNPIRTGLMATRLGIVALIVPFMFVYNPELIMQGSARQIILVAISAVIGVIALAGALEGYLFRRARWWERVLLGAGAVVLLAPWAWVQERAVDLNSILTAATSEYAFDVFGVLIVLVAVATQYIAMKHSPPVPAAELAESSPLDSLSGPKEPFLGPME